MSVSLQYFHTVPIYEACALHHAILPAGRDFSKDLMKVVTEREYSSTAAAERGFVRDIKEEPRFIGADYDTELISTAETDKEKSDELADENSTEQGYPLSAAAERELARDVEEKPCCICLDLDTEHKSTAEMDKEKTFEPPDENFITVGAKRFRCVDVDIRKKNYEPPDGNNINVST